MDIAKIVAVVLKHGGRARDYFGFGKVSVPVVPLIAIPTTAGTGSEVSHSAVLTDTVAQVKAIRNIQRFLVRAVETPSDRDARDGMAYAAMLAGMAFSNSGYPN